MRTIKQTRDFVVNEWRAYHEALQVLEDAPKGAVEEGAITYVTEKEKFLLSLVHFIDGRDIENS